MNRIASLFLSFSLLFEEKVFQEVSLKTHHEILATVTWRDQAVSPDLKRSSHGDL